MYGVTEGSDDISEEFYETLQKILDKVNKNDYIVLIGDMNGRIGKNRVANIVGSNGETTLNGNGKKTDWFLHIQYSKKRDTFLSTNKFINFLEKQRTQISYRLLYNKYEKFESNSRY